MPKTLKKRIMNAIVQLYIRLTGSSLAQSEQGGEEEGPRDPQRGEILRRAAAEGAVLLKNDGTLPLSGTFALFGRCQQDTLYSGYGTGGDVRRPYAVSIVRGLTEQGACIEEGVRKFYEDFLAAHPADRGGWGDWPFSYPEPEVPQSVLDEAAAKTDRAVVVIGRASGEDRDSEPERGSYYLTDAEEKLLSDVTARFAHVAVVLNIGSVMDMVWTKRASIGAVLLIWQGGMETGNACADVLLGRQNPCGKLPMSVLRLDDYPKNFGDPRENSYDEGIYLGYRATETRGIPAIYPFGRGLSYTNFELKARVGEGRVQFTVRNSGPCAGKTVVQIYVGKPSGQLRTGDKGCPQRELVCFRKTALLAPQEEQTGEVLLEERLLSAYDPARSAFVLQRGTYAVFVGFDAHTADMVGTFAVNEEKIVEQCTPILHENLKARIQRELPTALPNCPPSRWEEVCSGKRSVEEFVGGLSDDDLIALSRGDLKMDSPLGPSGNAGVMGGVTPSLRARGVPAVSMADGPSGVRLRAPASLVPIATLLASTFDPALVREVYRLLGQECKERGTDVLLAPALNLQRHPLCGRNFEYFSEDPLLAGKLAAAAVCGLREGGAAACPKHFACNNQEFGRNLYSSNVDERTLRELYLRPFEIAVREGQPDFLMTAYNKINGVYAHYHYALVRGIVREEWGFAGCVVTDWWMRKGRSPDFRPVKNNAYRIRAGVNVLMPGGNYVGKGIQFGPPAVGKKNGLTRAELQRNAAEVLQTILRLGKK